MNTDIELPKKKVNKSGRTRRKHRKFKSFEEREHLYTELAKVINDPFRPRYAEIANKFNIHLSSLMQFKRDPLYIKIAARLLETTREKYEPEVQRSLIKRAIDGSVAHQNLFYLRHGALIQKHEHSNKPTDIPKDPEDIERELLKLQSEVGTLKLRKK